MSEYTQSISQTEGAYIHRPDGKTVPLVKDIYKLNELLARAEKAEAQRDELIRKLSEARVKESWEATSITVAPDWQRVRIEAAIAAMQGLLAGGESFVAPMEVVAVECADALVAELQKKEVKK